MNTELRKANLLQSLISISDSINALTRTRKHILDELETLGHKQSLSDTLSYGDWIIHTARNSYYQFVEIDLKVGTNDSGSVILNRHGEQKLSSVKILNTNYTKATASDVERHLRYLNSKNIGYIFNKTKQNNVVVLKEYKHPLQITSKPAFDTTKCEFYMITVGGEHGSKVRHTSYDVAVTEATRLSKLQNAEAFIVGVVASVKPVTEIKTITTTKVVPR